MAPRRPDEPCPGCGRMMTHTIAVMLGSCDREDCPMHSEAEAARMHTPVVPSDRVDRLIIRGRL